MDEREKSITYGTVSTWTQHGQVLLSSLTKRSKTENFNETKQRKKMTGIAFKTGRRNKNISDKKNIKIMSQNVCVDM